MKYNKLVRDKIPDIIHAKGGTYKVHLAKDDEYWAQLKRKLNEEVEEFLAAENAEELADVLEVIHAIIEYKKLKYADVDKLRMKKFDERGGFSKRIILDESN